MNPIFLALALLLPPAPLRAALNARDVSFVAALDAPEIGQDAGSMKRRARWDERLRKWLGPFDAFLKCGVLAHGFLRPPRSPLRASTRPAWRARPPSTSAPDGTTR